MKKPLLTLGGTAAAIVLIVLVGVGAWSGIYDDGISLKNLAKTQWAQVENACQRQSDLIPNLVETVKGQADFEKSALTEITQARASIGQMTLTPAMLADPKAMAEFNKAQACLGGALSRLLVVSENYPDLKANAAFQELRAELAGSQTRIATERVRYNRVVGEYNELKEGLFSGIVLRNYPSVFPELVQFQADEGAKATPKAKL